MTKQGSDSKPSLAQVLERYQHQYSNPTELWHSESAEHLDSYNELLNYLAGKGAKHRDYRHYVPRKRAESILNDSTFYLSDGSGWNDEFDRMRFNPSFSNYKHFGTCFSASREESIAMWMLYGGSDRNGVMINFTPAMLNEAMAADGYECGHFEGAHFVKVLDIDRSRIDLSLVDVLYFRSGANTDEVVVRRPGDKQVTLTQQEFNGIQQVTKHEAWSYEREVRLVARIEKSVLRGKGSRVTSVKIPFRLPDGFCDTHVFDSPVSDGSGIYSDSALLKTVTWDLCKGCPLKVKED